MGLKRFRHPCASDDECRQARAVIASLMQVPLRPSLGMSDEASQPASITPWRQYPRALHMALLDGDAAISDGATPPCDSISWHYRELRCEAPGFRPGDYLHSSHEMIVVTEDDEHVRACEQCGLPFTRRRASARFCSPLCRKRANRRVRVTLSADVQGA
jgi:hypothetical protein